MSTKSVERCTASGIHYLKAKRTFRTLSYLERLDTIMDVKANMYIFYVCPEMGLVKTSRHDFNLRRFVAEGP